MAGIEGITEEILTRAKNEAAQILAEAEAEATRIKDAAKEESEKMRTQAQAETEEKTAAQKERADSQAEMAQRQAILAEKQAIITEVVALAKEKLRAQDADAYFAMLLQILAQSVRKGEGEMFLAGRDLDRLPADFEKAVQEKAQSAGGTITISKTPIDIADGFVLRYGGIEENCSLDALFAEKKESLHDLVSGMLF